MARPWWDAPDHKRSGALALADSRRCESSPVRPELFECDAMVLCAGCGSARLGAKLGQPLPIYPIKGYSLTAPLLDADKAPRSTVIDDRYKIVATRLGDRLRVDRLC